MFEDPVPGLPTGTNTTMGEFATGTSSVVTPET